MCRLPITEKNITVRLGRVDICVIMVICQHALVIENWDMLYVFLVRCVDLTLPSETVIFGKAYSFPHHLGGGLTPMNLPQMIVHSYSQITQT